MSMIPDDPPPTEVWQWSSPSDSGLILVDYIDTFPDTVRAKCAELIRVRYSTVWRVE